MWSVILTFIRKVIWIGGPPSSNRTASGGDEQQPAVHVDCTASCRRHGEWHVETQLRHTSRRSAGQTRSLHATAKALHDVIKAAGGSDVLVGDCRLRGVLVAVLRRQSGPHLLRLPYPSVGTAVCLRAAGARPQRAQPAHLRSVQCSHTASIVWTPMSSSPVGGRP